MRNRLQLEDAYLGQIIDLFLEGLPTRRKSLSDAVAEGRTADLQRAAHTLKGTAANLVASGVTEAAAELEALARDGQLERLDPCREVVFRELERLEEALVRYRRKAPNREES